MAGISFMDLMFAEALASGLAREAQARRTERPPPDNFFVLPRDPQGWRQIQVACKKENMVIAIEITDSRNENCKRIHPHFVDMAREFDSVPFLRVMIGLGATYDELRKDIGGIQFTPTIVLVWFGEGSTYRAKFEGEGEIRQALGTGRLNGVMKEFLDRRVKLKLAEHMAEELATHVRDEMSEREKRIRRDYEEKLRREMAEKEELQQKEEEDKKWKEEEEEKKMDEKRRRAAEIRRESRPQNLEELMKMDLDTSPTRDIKAIMLKMGISPHDCFEKSDLKKKLIANVPELRIAIERKASQSSISSVSSTSSFSSGINNLSDPLGASGDQSDSLRKLEDEVADVKQKLSQKDDDIRCLTTDLQRMTTRANSAEDQVLALKRDASAVKTPPVPKPRGFFTRSASSSNDLQQVEELKKQLYEMRMLYTTTIDDYDILSLVHVGDGEGIVLRAKCTRRGMPNPDRVYAMKVLTNYFQTQTATQTRVQFQNEYQVLCQIPAHENIIHLFAFFFDRANPDISPHFKKCGANARTMSLFLLMDEHLMNMKQQLDTLVENQGPKAEKVVKWFIDLLKGLTFLDSHHVVHRDLKLENLLLDETGRVIVSDFGTAVMLDDTMATPFSHGFNTGGNQAHLSPEILNARPGPRRNISYKKQAVWAAGVLAYEFAGHPNPFSSGSIDQRGYIVDALQPLRYTYCKNSKFVQPLRRDFTQLVRSMLQPEACDRPTLQECLKRLTPLNI